MKGNHQGSLSRSINQVFKTFLKVLKTAPAWQKDFFDTLDRTRLRVRFCVESAVILNRCVQAKVMDAAHVMIPAEVISDERSARDDAGRRCAPAKGSLWKRELAA